MALKTNRSRPWLSRLHFLVRLLALTGLLAALVALVTAEAQGMLGSGERTWGQDLERVEQQLLAAGRGAPGWAGPRSPRAPGGRPWRCWGCGWRCWWCCA